MTSDLATSLLALAVTISPLAILGAILWQWHREFSHSMRSRQMAHAKK